jgi:RNA polymerase sigma-70 factor (sigma-E family)
VVRRVEEHVTTEAVDGGSGVQPAVGTVTQTDDFEMLFETHRAAALRLAYVLCGDAGAAEDIVADAFARMYPRWRRGGILDPAAYVRRAVVNQVHGRFRRLALQRRHEATRRPDVLVSPAPDATVAQRDELRTALLALPPRQRAAVALRHLEDLSEVETAAVLGVSVGTVKSSVARGLERLRATITTEAPEHV